MARNAGFTYAAALVALLAISMVPASSAAIAKAWGGAQPLEPVANALIALWNKGKPAGQQFAKYDTSSSSHGIAGFYNGTYLIGAASDAISADVEAANKATPKITIPLLVVTYSFFVSKPAGAKPLVLDARQSYQIFSGALTSWDSISAAKAAKLTGTIARIARSEKVATNSIFQSLWTKAATGYTGDTTGKPMTFAGLKFATGGSGMCKAIATTANSIGYSHTGGCLKTAGVAQVALRNKANVAVTSANWNAYLAFPKVVPKPDATWSGVNLIWTANAKAPPAVSMQYAFIKKRVSTKVGGHLAKKFLTDSIPLVGKFAAANGFLTVPPQWWAPSFAAVKAIVVAA